MPQYEYKCQSCDYVATVTRTVSQRDSLPPECRHKGKYDDEPHEMTRSISRTSFLLKGEGWYKDGYSKS